ncbi:hypothetical protein GCM10007315_33930 [Gemmobacter tilapiae]|uniref:Recombinase family protein n=1 Tax=Neogemmobacter tilapiae TaxID=875041 RepID=A0A918TXM0_9RHOB|nr:hypothetical protein GCM10007315_33930 [Gemmobacter tilapiae]
MNNSVVRKLRCAVYTRKSSEEGLEQEFNSLHAQREACEAYIASQRSEGWVLVRDQYDDGGISGGTLERPGLKRLLADIEDGLVDVVVVYKIDRLSRSLMDFSKLVEVFDRNGVTFVSVTQSFNTTTSMGRLTLNILLSFAQFEREVTAERIRDKVRASRMKGMWMGGCPPLGYEVKDRKLVINEGDAAHVHWVFSRFIEIGSGTVLAQELAERGVTTSRGHRIDKKFIYRMLNNRVYIGEAVHKGTSYPGEHKAIIDHATWDKVHAILTESPRKRASNTRADTPALLKGLLYGPDGAAFSPTHTRKGGRLYRYYVSQAVLKHGAGACSIGRVPAGGCCQTNANQSQFPQPLAGVRPREDRATRRERRRGKACNVRGSGDGAPLENGCGLTHGSRRTSEGFACAETATSPVLVAGKAGANSQPGC